MAVETDKLAANAVTADKILANSITAEKLAAVIVLASMFVTSSADPRVGLDSTGLWVTDSSGDKDVRVESTGLNLREGTSTEPPERRRVSWLDSGGTARSHVMTRLVSGLRLLRAQVSVDSTDQGQVQNSVRHESTGNFAALAAFASSSLMSARAAAGTELMRIIEGDGRSDFLKLATFADRKINFGTGSVGGLGGSNSGTTNVNHGLGVTPQSVVLTPNDGNNAAVADYTAKDDTTFTARIKHRDNGTNFPGGTSVGFDWIAIG